MNKISVTLFHLNGPGVSRIWGRGLLIESRAKFSFYAHARFAHRLSNAIMLVGVVGCCTQYTLLLH